MKYENNKFIFTRKERYKIYSLMIEHLESGCTKYVDASVYLCIVFRYIIRELFGSIYDSIIFDVETDITLECLPELWAYNPGKYVWFNTIEERIKVLKQCKKLTR